MPLPDITLNAAEQQTSIAAHSPIDVYVPTLEDEQYPSTNTGNYWPYRVVHHAVANAQPRAVARTADRCESLLCDMTAGNTHLTPTEFYTSLTAIDTEFDLAMARPVGTDVTRGWPETAQKLHTQFQTTDVPARTTNVLPIPAPHGIAAAGTPRASAYAITQSHCITATMDGWTTALQRVRDRIGWTPYLVLTDVFPTGELIRAIRETPQLVDAITISPRTVAHLAGCTQAPAMPALETSLAESLTTTGRRVLQTELDPAVQLAVETSLLASPLVAADSISEVLPETLVPDTVPEWFTRCADTPATLAVETPDATESAAIQPAAGDRASESASSGTPFDAVDLDAGAPGEQLARADADTGTQTGLTEYDTHQTTTATPDDSAHQPEEAD